MSTEFEFGELEALEAIYPDACHVFNRHPIHVAVDLKPYTAEDHTQQFVEVTLEIQASNRYPNEILILKFSKIKGLSEFRTNHLLNKLTTYMIKNINSDMLVGVCEETKEILSEFNFPEGECSFCKEIFYENNKKNEINHSKNIFKLLSCFHCYHLSCFKKFWKWRIENEKQKQKIEFLLKKEIEIKCFSNEMKEKPSDFFFKRKIKMHCSICRSEIQRFDIIHILNQLDNEEGEDGDDENINENDGHDVLKEIEKEFNSKSEIEKRENFRSIIVNQKSKGGIFENKKIEIKSEEFEFYFENNRSNFDVTENDEIDSRSNSNSNSNLNSNSNDEDSSMKGKSFESPRHVLMDEKDEEIKNRQRKEKGKENEAGREERRGGGSGKGGETWMTGKGMKEDGERKGEGRGRGRGRGVVRGEGRGRHVMEKANDENGEDIKKQKEGMQDERGDDERGEGEGKGKEKVDVSEKVMFHERSGRGGDGRGEHGKKGRGRGREHGERGSGRRGRGRGRGERNVEMKQVYKIKKDDENML